MEQKVFVFGQSDRGVRIVTDKMQSFYTHTHMYNEMLLYEAFDGYLTVNNEKIYIPEESILLVTTSDFHSTTLNQFKGERVVRIAFTDDIISQYILSKLAQPIFFSGYHKNPLMVEIIDRMLRSPENDEMQKILVNTLLLELCEVGSKIGSPNKKSTEVLLIKTLKTINEHFYEDITLQSVAKSLNVTPQYLSTVFSKHMEISFSEYLRDKRLKYAANQLSSRTDNVTEVCFSCGYNNLSHFIRSFKKKYGVSPKAYANQFKL